LLSFGKEIRSRTSLTNELFLAVMSYLKLKQIIAFRKLIILQSQSQIAFAGYYNYIVLNYQWHWLASGNNKNRMTINRYYIIDNKHKMFSLILVSDFPI